VIHTSELPLGNRTPDGEIIRFADNDNRVVATKDRDFVDSHILTGHPRAPLLVSTGNISNDGVVAGLSGCGEASEPLADFVEGNAG
jgi:predicted nuclease of predicted toxin-antitoxin system